MKLFFVVLCAIAPLAISTSAAIADQSSPNHFSPTIPHAKQLLIHPDRTTAPRIVNLRDRAIHRHGATYLAANSSPTNRPANLIIIVTPNPYNQYVNGSIRAPLFDQGTGEAGIFGRPSANILRQETHLSLFPRDEFDLDSQLGIYIQANF
jgi:hypothetical protein